MGRLATKTGPLVGDYSDGDEPADADAVVWSGSFEESLEWGEAEGLPDELCKGCVCAVGERVDDAHEREEVGLRVCMSRSASDPPFTRLSLRISYL